MNGLVVVAACVCAASGQLVAQPGLFNPAPSHQFHAQDEFGQFSFGHAGGPSARTEARNAFGVTTGSYQYIDANGLLQTVNYIADPVNGFRVAGTNLPVAAAAPEVAPLAAPVFDLPLPVAVEDTAEVAAAKAEFKAAFEAAAAAAAAAPEERKKRQAEEEAAPAAPALLPYPYAAAGLYAGLPGDIVANIAPATPTVAALPAVAGLPYAGLPAGLPYAGLPAGLPYAGLPAGLPLAGLPAAAALPLAAAAPSREAVLTTIKLNPGHAISYRVD